MFQGPPNQGFMQEKVNPWNTWKRKSEVASFFAI